MSLLKRCQNLLFFYLFICLQEQHDFLGVDANFTTQSNIATLAKRFIDTRKKLSSFIQTLVPLPPTSKKVTTAWVAHSRILISENMSLSFGRVDKHVFSHS